MINLELREPNDEQKLAIEHTGGVLLSAGAGSGKTFVLVEHIIYLFQKFYNENQVETEDFSKKIKEYFSKIVLMTFTNKAAGELEIRIQKRFKLALERAKEGMEKVPSKYWEVGVEALSHLYVGTIHGFCYRLINQGYIPGLTGNEELVSDVEFTRKVSILIDKFFEDDYWKENTNYYDRLVLNKKNLKQAMGDILSDTDLRVLWNESQDFSKLENVQREYLKVILDDCFDVPIEDLRVDYEAFRPTKKAPPQWFLFVEEYHKRTEGKTDQIELLKDLSESLETISRLAKPKKESLENPELGQFFDGVKAYRDNFLKNHFKHIQAFSECPEVLYKWGEDISTIYSFIEEQYLHYPGLTFTDLEFYVWKQLSIREVAERVAQSFNYFIIDEFQDTSNVQFEIVNSIIDSDMKRVFSVGDVKQAIYGFRGGELGVFKNASERTYQNLSLKNNYRSSAEVIGFNNELFDYLLPLGEKYSGEDKYTVEMIKQSIPENVNKDGKIKCIHFNIEDEDQIKKRWWPTDLNKAESFKISEIIKNKMPEEEYCILYRKLAPTKFLIPMLVESGVGFSCQVKVNLKEDPFLCLFIEFSRSSALKEDEDAFRASKKVLKLLLSILVKDGSADFENIIDTSVRKESSVGLLEAFKEFVWLLGLSSSNLSQSWPIAQTLCDITGDRSDLIFDYVSSLMQGSYSIEFQYGEDSDKVKIMTTHASKGLEFSKVILGGIHTNGGSKADNSFFGKLPGSYKWVQGVGKSKVFKSPALIFEEIDKKKKEFSEFKRLFYVATTRAVNEIIWINLSVEAEEKSHGQDSWVNGLRAFVSERGYQIEDIQESLPISNIFSEDENLGLNPPMFFKDNLGLEFCEAPSDVRLAMGAELSVTRLAGLLQCPRKFFLKNVLKISETDLDLVEVEGDENEKIEFLEEGEQEPFQIVGPQMQNSKDRGIAVHFEIEYAVKHNFTLRLGHELDEKTRLGVEWVLKELKKLRDLGYQFISEEPVKFALFGQMLSGTPDLVLLRENEILIWDFKTGSFSEEKSRPYWLQLYAYAHAYIQKLKSLKEPSIKLVLAFVDDRNLVEQIPSKSEVRDRLFEVWKLLEFPDQLNLKHCRFCEFQNICLRG